MNNNNICNPKVEVTKGIDLNEKDYMNCLLTTLKNMEKNYVMSMIEASNESLYQKYLTTFQSISNLQRKTYEMMFKYGWYNLETADKNKITEKFNMLNQEYIDLNK